MVLLKSPIKILRSLVKNNDSVKKAKENVHVNNSVAKCLIWEMEKWKMSPKIPFIEKFNIVENFPLLWKWKILVL